MKKRRKAGYRILPVAGERGRRPTGATDSLEERALALFKRPRRVLIAEAAYYRALGRGFADGDPLEDWLAAEAEIDALLEGALRSTARNQR